MDRSFLKGAVVGLICAVLGGGAVALAGSGVGGVFNLGVSNSVDQPTRLTGASPGAQLGVTNTSAGGGSYGLNVANASAAAPAVYASNNSSGIGVQGNSSTGVGVLAQTASMTLPAIKAQNTGGFPAASFLTNANVPPFRVNQTAKVVGLNADFLDGKDSTALTGHAYGVSNPFSVVALNTGLTTVASVDVPAGSYVVTAATTIAGSTSASPDNIGCYLFSPAGSELTAAYGNTYATDDQSVIFEQGLVSNTTGGTISMQCVDSDATASAFYPSLMANDVGSVSGYSGSAPTTGAPTRHGPRP